MAREDWHRIGAEEALQRLDSSPEGLTGPEAARRLARYGPNVLREEVRRSALRILLGQFTDVMILILLAAALIAAWMGHRADTVMILIIVGLNAALGFSQEYRAERALTALRRLEQPLVVVRRAGSFAQIPSRDLVPGDLMMLGEGQRIPADGRLIEAARLRMDESHLTGESVPVLKRTRALADEAAALGDRFNMVYMGTAVAAGHGRAVVTESGMRTELGRIAHLLQSAEERATPLQRRLAYFGKRLAAAALFLTAVIFGAGLLRGEPPEEMLLTAISLAVAAIPEGLPAVVTIVLALGARNMARQNALIRKLPAVETLGSVTVICSDKTGTLTQNLMSVELLCLDGRKIDVTGNGYRPEGRFYEAGREFDPKRDPAVMQLLRAAALCTTARLEARAGREWRVLGDPTEGALLAAAGKAGLDRDSLERDYPRLGEIPFDSNRKMMTTLHRDPSGKLLAFSKGGIEEILHRSTASREGGEVRPLSQHRREAILRTHRELAADGVRVLACAMGRPEGAATENDWRGAEEGLIFLGLLGMMDPPRPEVREAVSRCRAAGIRSVMVTGDHRVTAEAVAMNLGIRLPGDRVLSGEELSRMTESELSDAIEKVSVIARVSPEHKVMIIRALQQRGEIVAMTGDGVNDAPALRAADIGVAMGRRGTDVAREASDLVLLDDNFATIVRAAEGGRTLYDNIRKFTRYMLSTNSGELLTMFFAVLFALPLPLVAVQILWINLVTDSLPALALAREPAERDVMRRPPRSPRESLFSGGLGLHVVWAGLLMGLGTIGIFGWVYRWAGLEHGRTAAFFTLTLYQMFHVMAIRSEKDFLWRIGLFSNPALLGAVLLAFLLQLAITFSPPLQPFFGTTALASSELAACVLTASTIYLGVEGEKWMRYRKAKV